ncbi:MAG TPA: glycosyltransferase family 39 protein [Drouetiella sp.]
MFGKQIAERFAFSPLVLLLACIGLYFVRLGSFGILEGGESYYPAACREMLRAHEWIVPQLNYQIYFSKPILTFWLIESAFSIFGVSELSGRLWSAALSTALVFVCYATTKALSNDRTGLLAGLMLASSPLMVATCRRSSIDVYFSVFLGMALCAMMMVLFAKRTRWWPVIWIGLALAALSKGPAAIVLFLGGLVGYLILKKSGFKSILKLLKEIRLIPGVVLFFAIILPWCIAVSQATKGLFLKVFFLYENLSRFQGNTNSGKHPHWWAYIPALLYGAFPWSLYFPAPFVEAIGLLRQRFFGGKKSKDFDASPALLQDSSTPAQLQNPSNSAQKQGWTDNAASRNQAKLFALAYILVTVVFFSISRTQFDRYILPIWAPLVMMIALDFDEWSQNINAKPLIAKFHAIISPLLAVVGCLAAVASFGSFLIPNFEIWMRVVGSVGLFVLAAGWIYAALQTKRKQIFDSILTIALTSCVGFSIITPVLFEYWYQQTYAGVHELVKSIADTDADVAQYKEFMPSLLYYRQGPVYFFYHLSQMLPRANPKYSEPQPPPAVPGQPRVAGAKPLDHRIFILVKKDYEPEVVAAAPMYNLKLNSRKGEWSMWETSDFVFDKPPTLETSFNRLNWKDSMTDKFGFGPLTVPYSGGDKIWIR